MKTGIDVSYAQGYIDWCKVVGKIDFAIVRGGYYDTFDRFAHRNLLNCNAHEIPCGIYWFSYAFNVKEAVMEAKKCLALASAYKLQYPIIFDLEDDSVYYAKRMGVELTPEKVKEIAIAFCQEIEKAGYYAMIYCNLNWYRNWYGPELFSRYGLWLANPSRITNNSHPQLEQYSWKGLISGIGGNVDLNFDYVNLDDVILKAALNHLF